MNTTMKHTIRKPAALLSVTFEERVKCETSDVVTASRARRAHSPEAGAGRRERTELPAGRYVLRATAHQHTKSKDQSNFKVSQ